MIHLSGLGYIANKAFKNVYDVMPSEFVLHLYKNQAYAPFAATLGAFEELNSSDGGYAALHIPVTAVSVEYTPGGVYISFSPQLFTFSMEPFDFKVFGYYVTSSDGILICSESLPLEPFIPGGSRLELSIDAFIAISSGTSH